MKVKLKKPDVGIILVYNRDPEEVIEGHEIVLKFIADKMLAEDIELELDEKEDALSLAIFEQFPHLKA